MPPAQAAPARPACGDPELVSDEPEQTRDSKNTLSRITVVSSFSPLSEDFTDLHIGPWSACGSSVF